MSNPLASSSKAQACAVCGWLLEEITEYPNKRFWQHVRAELQDHPPVPVDPSELAALNKRCDFCDLEVPAAWAVLASDFHLIKPNGDGFNSRGHWDACESCGPLWRRHAIGSLITRVKNEGSPAGRRVPRKVLNAVYEALLRAEIETIPIDEWRRRVTSGLSDTDD
jgi:hypothetical protein